jgi:hypothetical protein
MMMEDRIIKYKGFKLISLKLFEVKPFGTIDFEFIDENDLQDKIYSTVIIGPNGTKKSLLFNLIIHIFKTINDIKLDKIIIDESTYSNGFYEMNYSLDDRIHTFSRNTKQLTQPYKFGYLFKLDNVLCRKEDFEIPSRIIANSTTIRDKFPYIKQGDFDRYNYLGIKSSPQSASTKAYLKKIIDYVADNSTNNAFIQGLRLLSKNFVGEENAICIVYKTSQYKKFFSNEISSKDIGEYFSDMEERFISNSKRPPNSLFNYKKIRDRNISEINAIVEFCNNIERLIDIKIIPNYSNRNIKFNLSDENDLKSLKKYNSILKNLYQIGLLSEIKLEFSNSTELHYTLEESSSGEHNLITSFIGFMATVKPNCLLLIDEPEISLHPNWQMRYVSFIKELFNNDHYKNSHIIINSHSNFIVSDLEGQSSKIIGLKKENGKIAIVDLPRNLNTFGWSVEEILLKVFNVTSVRNYFIAEKLGIMLDFIADEENNQTSIKDKYFELELDKVTGLSEEDPLKQVFDRIIAEYVS